MITKLNADISEDAVYRYLGYIDHRKPPAPVIKKVDEVLGQIPTITGSVIHDEFEIVKDEKNLRLYFQPDHYFTGEFVYKGLAHCPKAVAAISTLNSSYEGIYREFSDMGMIYEMIVNAVGTTAIEDINSKFWYLLRDKYVAEGLGLTRRYAPGDHRWELSDQGVMFEILDGNSIGVKLNDSFVMIPVKSLTMIYGLMEGPCEDHNGEHDCENCSNYTCEFRIDA